MPAAAGKVNGAPDDLFKDDLAGKPGLGFKAKPPSVTMFGIPFGFTVPAQSKTTFYPNFSDKFEGAPSVKFAVPVGDVKFAVDKLALNPPAKGGVALESTITTPLDKNFKLAFKGSSVVSLTKGEKKEDASGVAECLSELKVEYKLPDVTIDCKLTPGKIETVDKSWTNPTIALGFGLAPISDLGLGIKLQTPAADTSAASLSLATDYKLPGITLGAGLDKFAPLKKELTLPPVNFKAFYDGVKDLQVGGKVDYNFKDSKLGLSLGAEYSGIDSVTLGTALFPTAEKDDAQMAAISAKYAVGKASAALGVSLSKGDLTGMKLQNAVCGLTFELA